MPICMHCGCECDILGGCPDCSEEDDEDMCLDCKREPCICDREQEERRERNAEKTR